ncbi:MAG: phosphoribosylglycinamide formyltransferase [Bacteroidetes bacterium]|nr:phosphoribosylglycinamide formyltransferase [Bacteroidota bacterium]
MQVNIAIFASGAGTNAENLITHFNKSSSNTTIQLIVCNKEDAGVLNIAKKHTIETLLVLDKIYFTSDQFVADLKSKHIDFIVLSGFLWLIPTSLLKNYSKKIINIHPSLLPKYGGKGMYGNKVHEAVLKNKERESGITIHYVDEKFDSGEVLFQHSINIESIVDAAALAEAIHQLEYKYFPMVTEQTIKKTYNL